MRKEKKPRTPRAQPEKKTKRIKKEEHPKESSAADRSLILTKLNNKRKIEIEFPYVTDQEGIKKLAFSIANTDSLYYTPMFILPDQKTPHQQRQHLKMHKDRVQIEENQIDVRNIQIPKPSVRNSYCTICKTRFDDYLEHTKLNDHLYKMRMSEYNDHIKELCALYPASSTYLSKKSYRESPKNEESTYYIVAADPFVDSSIEKQVFKIGEGEDVKEKLYQKVRGYHNKNQNREESLFDVLI